jgi:hypothetical protein
MRRSSAFVRSSERNFQLILEKVLRVGEKASNERRNRLTDMATRSIRHLSRTGHTREDIHGSVNHHLLALDEIVTYVNDIPVAV